MERTSEVIVRRLPVEGGEMKGAMVLLARMAATLGLTSRMSSIAGPRQNDFASVDIKDRVRANCEVVGVAITKVR